MTNGGHDKKSLVLAAESDKSESLITVTVVKGGTFRTIGCLVKEEGEKECSEINWDDGILSKTHRQIAGRWDHQLQ